MKKFSEEDKKDMALIRGIIDFMKKNKFEEVWNVLVDTPTEEIKLKITMERKKR